MNKVVYCKPDDAVNFDLKKYMASIRKYVDISEEVVLEGLKELEQYQTVHNSRLTELAARLIYQYGTIELAEDYLNNHSDSSNMKFERLRRITGYLVGTLDRWNDGKRAEESERVKHTISEKDLIEKKKREQLDGYLK